MTGCCGEQAVTESRALCPLAKMWGYEGRLFEKQVLHREESRNSGTTREARHMLQQQPALVALTYSFPSGFQARLTNSWTLVFETEEAFHRSHQQLRLQPKQDQWQSFQRESSYFRFLRGP